jgi:hypothetical protein
VVVAEGVTDFVPPLPAIVQELPSEPVTATEVAFDVAIVKVEEAPADTVVGLATRVTVGAGVAIPVCVEEQPLASIETRNKARIKAKPT